MYKCDVCLEPIGIDVAGILTTRQIVTAPVYWAYFIKGVCAVAGVQTMEADDSVLQDMVETQCAYSEGWLVCPRCMSFFPDVDDTKARGHVRKWLAKGADDKWIPPGGGSVAPAKAWPAVHAALDKIRKK